MNYKQIKSIENERKKILLKHNPKLNEHSGIYILTREDGGFKFAYIGQAKNILERLSAHLNVRKKNPQHIDRSINKHKLYSAENTTGWKIDFFNCNENELNDKEQEMILVYANAGFQLRNKTTGSQGSGKKDLTERVVKGYRNGLENGYKNAQKDIAKLFEKNLIFAINGKENVNKLKAYEKFKMFLEE